MEIAGFLFALLIGVSLGLIGGGGSILTIPLLVYFFHIPPTIATGYSLFIVGISSLTGAVTSYKNGNINFNASFYFGITSIATVVLIRHFLLPIIPEQLFQIAQYTITRSLLTMILLAILMVVASFNMILKASESNTSQPNISRWTALIRGIEIGMLTGLLGAGGGFLIIPVLIFSFKLPMKQAIGSSLFIIALNALFGFAADMAHYDIHWKLLVTLTSCAVVGTFIGNKIGTRIAAENLKKGFGIFILLAGLFILMHELFF